MAVNLIQLLQMMVQQKGSDLHVAAHSVPMIRVRGEMLKIDVPPLAPADVESMVGQVVTASQKMELLEKKSIDFSFKAQGVGIFRVNLFYQRHGLSIVMRILTEAPPRLEDLNLPPICKAVTSYPNGLVLITGPTGSGKSTTLAAMLNHINMTEKGHILTLEDPIEFQHESKVGMVNQRSLGAHFTDFSSALKAALREDPDVILIGEMRDAETVELALKAAETGHLVFSTLHTNSAAKSIDRIINTFPPEQQAQVRTVLSETLRAVISQKLVPSADKKRRICIHDIFVNTPAAANLIREGKTFQLLTVQQTGRKDGMQVMDQVLLDYVKSGIIDGGVAWEYANDKGAFAQWASKDSQDVSNKVNTAAPSGPTPIMGGAQVVGGTPPLKKTG
jgi:twitching motility protein PilT